jgi:hypothetical protein
MTPVSHNSCRPHHEPIRCPDSFLVLSEPSAETKVLSSLFRCLLSSKICLRSKLKLNYKSNFMLDKYLNCDSIGFRCFFVSIWQIIMQNELNIFQPNVLNRLRGCEIVSFVSGQGLVADSCEPFNVPLHTIEYLTLAKLAATSFSKQAFQKYVCLAKTCHA